MLTHPKNHALSKLQQKELINLHHTAKFGVKRLKVKLIMNFYNMPNDNMQISKGGQVTSKWAKFDQEGEDRP